MSFLFSGSQDQSTLNGCLRLWDGHSPFPVLEEGVILGIIMLTSGTRSTQHGLHTPYLPYAHSQASGIPAHFSGSRSGIQLPSPYYMNPLHTGLGSIFRAMGKPVSTGQVLVSLSNERGTLWMCHQEHMSNSDNKPHDQLGAQ